jgi:antitoxin HicB
MESMNYLCVIGKYKRGWHGIFPDFAGEIIVGASTQKALEAKLANVLGAHLQAIGHKPKPRFKTLKRIDPDLLEGLTDISSVMIEPASVNPVSLEVVRVIQGARVSKAEIAKRMGTTQSVLSRLSDPEYAGHTVGVLQRLAEATDTKLKVAFE